VRVWLCFWVVVWFFGAVFGWAFGCQRACGVCSRLLEMADFRGNPCGCPLCRKYSAWALTNRGDFPRLKGVGFWRACLLAALPSRAPLPPCERDARAPSTRDAGNAGVPPAMPTAREKTYPFEGREAGGEGKNARLFRPLRTQAMCPCQDTSPSRSVWEGEI